jgi:quercetin dioxygenase-like cupin family protein
MSESFFSYAGHPDVAIGEGGLTRRLLGFGGGLMLAQMDFAEGAVSAPHAHATEQLTHCLSGEFECSVGDESRRLGPGDSFYAGPGLPHGARCIKAGRLLHVFTPQREDYK